MSLRESMLQKPRQQQRHCEERSDEANLIDQQKPQQDTVLQPSFLPMAFSAET